MRRFSGSWGKGIFQMGCNCDRRKFKLGRVSGEFSWEEEEGVPFSLRLGVEGCFIHKPNVPETKLKPTARASGCLLKKKAAMPKPMHNNETKACIQNFHHHGEEKHGDCIGIAVVFPWKKLGLLALGTPADATATTVSLLALDPALRS